MITAWRLAAGVKGREAADTIEAAGKGCLAMPQGKDNVRSRLFRGRKNSASVGAVPQKPIQEKGVGLL